MKEIEMKQQVLGMLKDFLMGREGSKFKPKEIHVEMMSKPTMEHGKEGLDEVLKEAAEAEPMEREEDEEEDTPKKMSLQDFLASR